jgi:hypothetical protein
MEPALDAAPEESAGNVVASQSPYDHQHGKRQGDQQQRGGDRSLDAADAEFEIDAGRAEISQRISRCGTERATASRRFERLQFAELPLGGTSSSPNPAGGCLTFAHIWWSSSRLRITMASR